MNATTSQATPAAVSSQPDKMSRKKILIIVLGIIALFFAAHWLYNQWRFVETDDANIVGHTLMLAPKVSGIVEKVNVIENQKVKAGDVLAQLNDQDYATAV